MAFTSLRDNVVFQKTDAGNDGQFIWLWLPNGLNSFGIGDHTRLNIWNHSSLLFSFFPLLFLSSFSCHIYVHNSSFVGIWMESPFSVRKSTERFWTQEAVHTINESQEACPHPTKARWLIIHWIDASKDLSRYHHSQSSYSRVVNLVNCREKIKRNSTLHDMHLETNFFWFFINAAFAANKGDIQMRRGKCYDLNYDPIDHQSLRIINMSSRTYQGIWSSNR